MENRYYFPITKKGMQTIFTTHMLADGNIILLFLTEHTNIKHFENLDTKLIIGVDLLFRNTHFLYLLHTIQNCTVTTRYAILSTVERFA